VTDADRPSQLLDILARRIGAAALDVCVPGARWSVHAVEAGRPNSPRRRVPGSRYLSREAEATALRQVTERALARLSSRSRD